MKHRVVARHVARRRCVRVPAVALRVLIRQVALPSLPEAAATHRAEEVLLEGVVQEAVERRVDACVAVAEQVQEGGKDAHALRVFTKQQVHLSRKKPQNSLNIQDGRTVFIFLASSKD